MFEVLWGTGFSRFHHNLCRLPLINCFTAFLKASLNPFTYIRDAYAVHVTLSSRFALRAMTLNMLPGSYFLRWPSYLVTILESNECIMPIQTSHDNFYIVIIFAQLSQDYISTSLSLNPYSTSKLSSLWSTQEGSFYRNKLFKLLAILYLFDIQFCLALYFVFWRAILFALPDFLRTAIVL